MSVCFIISGGDFNKSDLHMIEGRTAEYVIAADAGFNNAKSAGLEPDLLIGDFDTLENPEKLGFGGRIVRYPKEKDDTDTMLAARLAIQKGYDEIYIFGALGGRLDHTFANIQTLNFIASHGKKGVIVSKDELISVLCAGSHKIKKITNFTLSLFAFSESVSDLFLDNTKYTLSGGKLSFDFPLGACNEFAAENADISFSDGRLLVICSNNKC